MWFNILKVAPIVGRLKQTSPTMRTKLKEIPTKKPEPQTTCVEEFNKIVDEVRKRINVLMKDTSVLWNTSDGEIDTTSKDFWNQWEYFYVSNEDYHRPDRYHKKDKPLSQIYNTLHSRALFMFENSLWYAQDEKVACVNIKWLSENPATKQPRDYSDSLSHSIMLNTDNVDDKFEHFGDWWLGGGLQLTFDMVEPKDEDLRNQVIPDDKWDEVWAAVQKIAKAIDDIFVTIMKMAQQAVYKLELE